MNTEYGRLAILRPLLTKKLLANPNTIIRDVSYIDDNISTNFAYTLLKNKPDFLLYRPENHFGNSVSLFKSLRKKLMQNYFGTEKQPENPFRNCTSPKEIFNLSRNIKFNIKMQLSRIGFVALRSGEVSITHRDASTLHNNIHIQTIVKDIIKSHEAAIAQSGVQMDKFSRYDYFLSAETYEGIVSSNNYVQKGITVKALGDKQVFTNYGVFNPTREDYLGLFSNYLRENTKDIKHFVKNAIDIGCGTGILSLIMASHGIPRIFAVDSFDKSIEATTTNVQALGYVETIKPVQLDLVEEYSEKAETQLFESKSVQVSKG